MEVLTNAVRRINKGANYVRNIRKGRRTACLKILYERPANFVRNLVQTWYEFVAFYPYKTSIFVIRMQACCKYGGLSIRLCPLDGGRTTRATPTHNRLLSCKCHTHVEDKVCSHQRRVPGNLSGAAIRFGRREYI